MPVVVVAMVVEMFVAVVVGNGGCDGCVSGGW